MAAQMIARRLFMVRRFLSRSWKSDKSSLSIVTNLAFLVMHDIKHAPGGKRPVPAPIAEGDGTTASLARARESTVNAGGSGSLPRAKAC